MKRTFFTETLGSQKQKSNRKLQLADRQSSSPERPPTNIQLGPSYFAAHQLLPTSTAESESNYRSAQDFAANDLLPSSARKQKHKFVPQSLRTADSRCESARSRSNTPQALSNLFTQQSPSNYNLQHSPRS